MVEENKLANAPTSGGLIERDFHVHAFMTDRPEMGHCMGVSAISQERAMEMVKEVYALANPAHATTVTMVGEVTGDAVWMIYKVIGSKLWMDESDMDRLRDEAHEMQNQPLQITTAPIPV